MWVQIWQRRPKGEITALCEQHLQSFPALGEAFFVREKGAIEIRSVITHPQPAVRIRSVTPELCLLLGRSARARFAMVPFRLYADTHELGHDGMQV